MAVEVEDDEAVDPESGLFGVAEVVGEGRLAVGGGGEQAHASAVLPDRARGQEAADGGPALVLVRLGRHARPGVLGEQGHDAVDVAALEGVGEALDERAFGPRGRQPATIAREREPLERAAGPLQRAVDRGGARVEHLGRLRRAEAEYVTQDQCGALRGREPLQRADEGQRDGLLGLEARVGPGDLSGSPSSSVSG